MIRRLRPALLFAVFWAGYSLAFGAEFFVAPRGRRTGDGTLDRPWDLATALSHPAAVQPGDTIWLRGGTYTFPQGGHILCGLRGTATAPITVAQYPGERATLDIKGAARGLFFTNSPNPAGSAHVRFKDFEMTNSDPNRTTRPCPVAVYVRLSDHLQFINMIVHDVGIAFGLTNDATNAEVYGSLVYYNDAKATSGIAHGIYIQNERGYKKAIDNIVFNNSGFGIHAFPHADDSALLDVRVVGNILFNNGLLGGRPQRPDLLVGGYAVAIDPVVDSNATYKATSTGRNNLFGYSAGCVKPMVTNNYLVGTTYFTKCTTDLVLTGNTFVFAQGVGGPSERLRFGESVSGLAGLFPANQYSPERPKGVKVVLRPNRHEPGRANIAVYNWDRLPFVTVEVAQILSPGDRFEVRSARNFFGPPVLEGTFDGKPLRLPMTGLAASAPIGLPTPPPTGPEFEVFIVRKPPGSRVAGVSQVVPRTPPP